MKNEAVDLKDGESVTLRRKKGVLPPPKEDECLVDVLLSEIKSGNFSRRRRKQTRA